MVNYNIALHLPISITVYKGSELLFDLIIISSNKVVHTPRPGQLLDIFIIYDLFLTFRDILFIISCLNEKKATASPKIIPGLKTTN